MVYPRMAAEDAAVAAGVAAGKSDRQIAEETGKTRASVKNRRHRLRLLRMQARQAEYRAKYLAKLAEPVVVESPWGRQRCGDSPGCWI